ERTAVFRAVTPDAAGRKPAASESAESDDRADRFERPGSAGSASADAVDPAGPADSERTAVFRAVKPPVVPASEGSASGDAAKPADSERTAVFRAVKPGSAPAAPKGGSEEPADSERTAVFRAVKPDAAPPKASTFVPLRTDDVPARPDAGQKPKTAPTGPGVHPADRKQAAQAPAPAAPAKPAPAPAPAPAKQAPAPAPAKPAASAASAPRSVFDSPERTTQQPLPPKPPLDMLADLTNNPPPPPSPMRTAVRRFKIYAPLVALLAIVLAVVQLVRPLPQPELVMTAKSSYSFGGSKPNLPWPSEGQAYMAAAGLGTLGQSGEQKPVPIASVTKSMTAYIILRDHPIKKGEQGQMIDIDKTAETEGKKNNSTDNESTLDTVQEGQKISEYDAIAALMIPSANNIARLLARWDAGSQEAFVKKMNDTAKELGMKNTTYTDPSGLDATTVSTAEDQVKLGLKLVEIETLLEITKKPNWTDPSGKTWRNWNGLVPADGSLGIKTGTTTKAGGNLLFAAQKKIGNTNQLIVGAVLGQHKPPIIDSVIAASKQLMLATQKALEGAPVVKKGEVVGYVDDGLGGRTPVVATADVQAVGWAGLTVDVKLADGGAVIPQTARAGTEIGLLTVGEGASQVKVPVALQSDLAAPGIGSKLTRVG
ncbi:D-alanyl-D-alanine carboxypeptidase family protein, partial [Streptomyces xanthophaeus]|uniref:D-alanyl-D-alanine carboxypeptidase family protein n=1 Tax=Streptomyces xanthophaeus TaxID=67385 RepID=UPI0036697E3C